MTLFSTLLSATTPPDATKYYPTHLPKTGTYAGVGLLVVLAAISLVKKVIFLGLILIAVAVGLSLYHHGTINKWLDKGAKYKTEVTTSH